MKQPEEYRKDLYEFIDNLPVVKPEELSIGQTFIVIAQSYTRIFGSTNFALWKVRSVGKKFLKYQVHGDNGKSTPHTMSLKSTEVLRLADQIDVRRALQIKDEEIARILKIEQFDERSHDRYILWNEIFGDDYEGTGSEGFVIEVFDGNGRLIHRNRILSESHIEYQTGVEIKQMAEAYARGFYAEDRLTIEQKIEELS